MPSAASFAERWARDNLTRDPTPDELAVLKLFSATCNGDEAEAAKRARRYYKARGPGGLTELWHKRNPDGEDILCSCQDAYIVPLRARSVGGRRMTIVRLPAPTALDLQVSAKSLLSRWLMILDIRLREDPTPGEEVVFIDLCDLEPSHLKSHFKGTYWKDFAWCMKSAYPRRFSEVHVINTQRFRAMSLLILQFGMHPWRRSVVHVHSNVEINYAMGVDYFPVEGLPYEYGGKAGAMKDLNDEWTKKLLLNSKWLKSEERKYYDTELKPEAKSRMRHKNVVLNLQRSNESYDMVTRTHSCRSLHCIDIDEGIYGAYRTLKLSSDRDFYV